METLKELPIQLDAVVEALLSVEAGRRGMTPDELASALLKSALERKANIRPKAPERRH